MFIQGDPEGADNGFCHGGVLKLGQLLGQVMGFGVLDIKHAFILPISVNLSTFYPQNFNDEPGTRSALPIRLNNARSHRGET